MAARDELACVYAALILHDEGLEITADKIKAVTKASNVAVEPFYPTLFAKFLEGRSMSSLLTNVGGGGGAGEAVAEAPAAGGDAPKAEAKVWAWLDPS